jgi:hypothetical protein
VGSSFVPCTSISFSWSVIWLSSLSTRASPVTTGAFCANAGEVAQASNARVIKNLDENMERFLKGLFRVDFTSGPPEDVRDDYGTMHRRQFCDLPPN